MRRDRGSGRERCNHSRGIVIRRAKYEMAGIEYFGVPGITKECRDAVLGSLQYGNCVTKVRILSSAQEHGLLLTVNAGDLIAVKSGFASKCPQRRATV